MFGNLFEFEVVEAFEFQVASSQGISSFTQIVAQIVIAGTDKSSVLGFEIARLMLPPNKPRVFGESGLSGKSVDVAGFRDDPGSVDVANALNGCESLEHSVKLFFNCLVVLLYLLLKQANGRHRNSKLLVDGIRNDLRRSVRIFCRAFNGFGDLFRVFKMVSALFADERGEFFRVHIGKLVNGLEFLDECH